MKTKTHLFATLILVIFSAPVLAQATSVIKPRMESLRHAPDILTPSGKVIYGRAVEAAEDAGSKNAWAIYMRGRADMLIDDYSDAAVEFQKALTCSTNFDPLRVIYIRNLAYALLGKGDKSAGFKLLHDGLYYEGHNLYTSGFRMRQYMTYALLEDEAGNWKEAALAYNLAGGSIAKTQNSGQPNIVCAFNVNNPQPRYLKAAACAVLGICSWNEHRDETGNAALSTALAYMRTATRLEPNWPVAWFYLHLVLKAAGHHHQADVAYHRALSLAGSVDKLWALGRPPVMPQPKITVTKQ